jgi:hypothetical protein
MWAKVVLSLEMGETSHNITESMGLDSPGEPQGSFCSQTEHYDGALIWPIQYGIEDSVGIGILSFSGIQETDNNAHNAENLQNRSSSNPTA